MARCTAIVGYRAPHTQLGDAMIYVSAAVLVVTLAVTAVQFRERKTERAVNKYAPQTYAEDFRHPLQEGRLEHPRR
ncbi:MULTISPECIES: hypothetical protein [unclassified Rhodococcus (in: high G+C Gram-positive bacteria)]|jgi:hypothetical protein|uniref:hypothetical protein n=1 Tax=unclassified Rhodococcus (in: high G+C Gram-positive bacteria) TaxID=192944 RepID=UPI0002F198B4|nr:hypothetical protein [Rhodococcus sp. DK17]